jgi:hypothetical protein
VYDWQESEDNNKIDHLRSSLFAPGGNNAFFDHFNFICFNTERPE